MRYQYYFVICIAFFFNCTQADTRIERPIAKEIREADREAIKEAVQAVAKPDAEMPLPDLIQELTQKMEAAASELNFEVVAVLRDQIEKLTKES